MGRFRADRKLPPTPFGPGLARLANDGEVPISGAPPRFPHALLLADVKLAEAVESGDPARIDAARERLADGVLSLIASDRGRLAKLPDDLEHDHTAERTFLHDRVAVLELRLAALQKPLEVPEAPARPAVVTRTPAPAPSPRPSAASSEVPLSPGDGTSHAVA
jgi:hypothetical protein